MAKVSPLKPRKPRLTTKPIPRSAAVWEAEANGINAYLDRLKSYTADHGKKWVARQIEYNTLRLCDLIDHPPARYHVPREWREWRESVK